MHNLILTLCMLLLLLDVIQTAIFYNITHVYLRMILQAHFVLLTSYAANCKGSSGTKSSCLEQLLSLKPIQNFSGEINFDFDFNSKKHYVYRHHD